ncbi:adenylosuccinate lyase [Bacillus rubiinfantis]|uniref:adenylosuccinate lyase n=1 Tax=Bacillus rubiinfantis TaxID=1499680 RepID=UPI000693B359|nr:adenylosuccinate lyase [Bacillus rubiinfantis]
MYDKYNSFTLFEKDVSTEKMREIFSDYNQIQKQMDCEAALSRVEAALGLIPKEAAVEINNKSSADNISIDKLKQKIHITGHPFLALITLYKEICEGNTAQYVHWGATSQDIMDTAFILQLKEAYEVFFPRIEELYKIVAEKAHEFRNVIMVGRTNGQHAVPITLGYKYSIWGFELRRSIDRLHEIKDRLFVGELAGAVGTLASFGDLGLEIQQGFCNELGLNVPPVAWFASRDVIAEFVNNLAILGSTLGKIGSEVYALQKSEIAELQEFFSKENIGSSTMPHKRNPFQAMQLSSNAKLLRSYATAILNSQEHEHERDPRSLSVEYHVVGESCKVIHASLEKAIVLLSKLLINEDNMRRNINKLHGLIFSEAIMLAIGKKVGRQNAHEIIHELAMEAIDKQMPLKDLLKENEVVMSNISLQEIDDLMNPENYLGKSSVFAERIKEQKDVYFSQNK